MATWKLGPALAAGNTVVLKPSELTPLTRAAPRRDHRRHPPAGRAQRRAPARARPRATRSCATPTSRWCRSPATSRPARSSPATAADTLKRVHLELGGKAPVDRLRRRRHRGAWSRPSPRWRYYNSGQDCTAPCRVIAGPGVFDDLVVRAHRRASARSRPATRSTPTPRWARSSRPTSSTASAGMVDRGRRRRRRGHRRRRTRSDRPGFFYEPSVVVNPAQDSEIVQREVFGPVVIGAALHRRGRRRSRGRTTSTTASSASVWTTRRRARDAHDRGAATSAACGSTTTSRSCRRCRTAASSSRATARTCRSTRSRHYTELKHVMIKH